jgi:hypothetical protein
MTDDITALLEERGARYGRFMDHSWVTQALKDTIHHQAKKNKRFLSSDQKEALDMICHKIGRIVCGDPDYVDSWRDIAGYSQLVADRLEGVVR